MLKFRCGNSKIPEVLHMQNALENNYLLCNDDTVADVFDCFGTLIIIQSLSAVPDGLR